MNWCKEHSEIVCNKANVIYQKYTSGEQWGGRKRCLEFSKLEKGVLVRHGSTKEGYWEVIENRKSQ